MSSPRFIPPNPAGFHANALTSSATAVKAPPMAAGRAPAPNFKNEAPLVPTVLDAANAASAKKAKEAKKAKKVKEINLLNTRTLPKIIYG